MSKDPEDISPAVWALVQAINAEIYDGDGSVFDADIEEAERINAAIEEAGFVVLPREPTEAMITAGFFATPFDAVHEGEPHKSPASAEICYRAMINAYSPKPSGVEDE